MRSGKTQRRHHPDLREYYCLLSSQVAKGISMEILEIGNGKSSTVGDGPEASRPPRRGLFIAQLLLRFSTSLLAAAAIAVMVTARQTVVLFGSDYAVRYSYSSAFRFLADAQAIICCFSLLSLIFVSVFSRVKSTKHYFWVHMHDLVLMVLSMSACAAAVAVGYIGLYGQIEMGWAAVCGNVKMFCDKVLVALVLSLIGFVCLFLLTIMAAVNLCQSGR